MRASRRTAALAAALMIMLPSGCARPGDAPGGSGDRSGALGGSGGPTPTSDGRRSGVFPSTRVEPPTDADRPDGPTPTPDNQLSPVALAALVRQPASASAGPESCASAELRLTLTGLDAAAGHRYAQLVAANVGDRTCALVGWPGLGFRGEWGTPFPVVAERNQAPAERVGVPPADPDAAVQLAPGDRAVAEFEWTGALAGNRDERVSLIVVQVSADARAIGLAVGATDHVDLGADTTVRIGPWGRPG